jgi:serine/threonine protein kinase
LKLIDFGQSGRLLPFEKVRRVAGTVFYMSPEQVEQDFSAAGDIWSLGVVTFLLLYGHMPFYGPNKSAICDAIRLGFQPVTKPGKGPWFNSEIIVSDAAKDFLAQTLCYKSLNRITAYGGLCHPWLVDLGINLHQICSRL